MKIESVRIKNLRSFADVTVPFHDFTCLVGPNGSGKSTILCALNVFFRETENASTDLSQLDREDFHQKNTTDPIEVTVTFGSLSAEAQKDFSDYYRQGKVMVSAVATFNESAGKAEVKHYGQRLGMTEFKEFFRAVGDNKKVAVLKDLYVGIREAINDLPAPGTKDAMIESLRNYETAHPERLALLALVNKLGENPMPTASLWGTGFVMWQSNIGAVVRDDIGAPEWQAYQAEADRLYGHAGNLRKNTLHIGSSLAQAWAYGKKSPNLERLCGEILNPASTV